MKFQLKPILIFAGLFCCTLACKTKDILPSATITLDVNTMSENGGEVVVNATLNGAPNKDVRIQLAFAGTASINEDYTASSNEIVIAAGSNQGSITLTGLNDELIEGSETIIITLASIDGVIVLDDTPLTITILDGNVDSDGDGVPDSDDACPDLFGDVANNGCPFMGFIINEVLYDPADGTAGDANGDGTRDPLQDEFIEFFNSSATSIDISGYTIEDASQLRHTFPSGTIVPANAAIVVFGGGTPTGSFGGALVQTASEGQLNLNNAGDFITVRDASNAVILTFDINLLSGNPNESYTRFLDIYGEFTRHSTIPDAGGTIHSPGTQVSGNPF